MKIHYLQHETFETPGAILDWAKRNKHTLSSTMIFRGELLPSSNSFDMLVIMGGSMSVYDENQYQWMSAELRFIESAIKADKAVLGICLGAQLIARSLGAKVYPNKEKEIGWFPVNLTPEGTTSGLFKGWPKKFKIFQWHGDTFDIPAGAVRTASSEACVNQAFVYGEKTVALQFHPEITTEDLDSFLSTVTEESQNPGTYVQSVEQIRLNKDVIPGMNEILFRMLDAMAENIGM